MSDSMDFTRQFDIVNIEKLKDQEVVIIGAGAVGSATALMMAKMGVNMITVFDHDKIEKHNLPNQFYRVSDIGKPKVVALNEIVKDYTGTSLSVVEEKFKSQKIGGVVVVAVDSMDVRVNIWDALKYNSDIPLYIDTRMGAEVANVFTFYPLEDGEFYKDNLFPSSEAVHEACTRRSISYTAFGLAAIATGKLKKYIQREPFYKELVMDFHTFTSVGCHRSEPIETKEVV